jgi:hypothetical protein
MKDNSLDVRDWLLVILPFVGVIVGGLLSGGVQLWLRRSAERADRRLSARVMFDELSTARAALVTASEKERPTLLPESKRAADAWRGHRSALRSLAYDDWEPIQYAVAALEIFDHVFTVPYRQTWTPDIAGAVTTLVPHIDAGLGAVRRHVE